MADCSKLVSPTENPESIVSDDTLVRSLELRTRVRSQLEKMGMTLTPTPSKTRRKAPTPSPLATSMSSSQNPPGNTSTPTNVPSSTTLITSEALADSNSLSCFLTSMKVKDLQHEFKIRDIPRTGLSTKAQLIDRLGSILLPSPKSASTRPSRSQSNPDSSVVNCICGVKQNDGNPMVLCSVCDEWSHLTCYKLSESDTKKLKFKCKSCTSTQLSDSLIKMLTSQITDLFDKVANLSAQLNAHIKTCNSKFLASSSPDLSDSIKQIRSDIRVLSGRVSQLSSSEHRLRAPSTNRHSQQHSPPMSTYYIYDKSGLSDSQSISHLIKGVFSWNFPLFKIGTMLNLSLPGKIFKISIVSDFASFRKMWMSGVRPDIGISLFESIPSVPINKSMSKPSTVPTEPKVLPIGVPVKPSFPSSLAIPSAPCSASLLVPCTSVPVLSTITSPHVGLSVPVSSARLPIPVSQKDEAASRLPVPANIALESEMSSGSMIPSQASVPSLSSDLSLLPESTTPIKSRLDNCVPQNTSPATPFLSPPLLLSPLIEKEVPP